ncbi:MAG: 4-amino-4-deoxychorismate mutase [Rhodospirillaceae bacterium]|nr:4-amino-4-deoxychorismate mutase [Rhodospirillaceae bacterium]
MSDLEELRRRIDAIDDRIVALLSERFAVVRDVAAYKAPRNIPAMIPERIDEVRERCAAQGAELGIDPDFLRVLYSLIIDEACQMEEKLLAESGVKDHQRAAKRRKG